MTTDMGRLSGGTAVITGAGSGIGAALARGAAASGMDLVLADVSEARLEAVAAELTGAGPTRVVTVPTDVSDPGAVDRLADRAFGEFGAVALLCNNAGIESTGPLWEITPERWDRMIKVNLYGVVNGIRSFVPRMMAGSTPGAVVNTSSIGGLSVGAFQGAYIASKFAVQAVTECLAMELEAEGADITVSVVCPGPVATRIFDDAAATEGVAGSRAEAYRGTMQSMLADQGLDPDQAGAIILEGAAAGRFWILPQPDMVDEAVQRRSAMILARTAPASRMPV